MSLKNFIQGGCLRMIELVIFTEAIADELIARGFNLIGRGAHVWYFEDSELLESAVAELVEALQ